jgi:hypothetical protein
MSTNLHEAIAVVRRLGNYQPVGQPPEPMPITRDVLSVELVCRAGEGGESLAQTIERMYAAEGKVVEHQREEGRSASGDGKILVDWVWLRDVENVALRRDLAEARRLLVLDGDQPAHAEVG